MYNIKLENLFLSAHWHIFLILFFTFSILAKKQKKKTIRIQELVKCRLPWEFILSRKRKIDSERQKFTSKFNMLLMYVCFLIYLRKVLIELFNSKPLNQTLFTESKIYT